MAYRRHLKKKACGGNNIESVIREINNQCHVSAIMNQYGNNVSSKIWRGIMAIEGEEANGVKSAAKRKKKISHQDGRRIWLVGIKLRYRGVLAKHQAWRHRMERNRR